MPNSQDHAALEPIMVSVTDAARLLGIKKSLAYELVAQRVIPSMRLGPRCIRVPLEGLRRWALESSGMEQEGGQSA